LDQIRYGICALGVLTVSPEEYERNPNEPRFLPIVGTGFLVRDDMVMTNRHVLQDLERLHKKHRVPGKERRVLLFTYLRGDNGINRTFCFVRGAAVVREPAVLDVGIVKIERDQSSEFEQCQPLRIGERSDIAVGQPIAVSGYALGERLLIRPGDPRKIYRSGPITQQGFISAIAPYDNSPKPEQLLLDVRANRGMSGSPVYRPEDGRVIGLFWGGATPKDYLVTAFAIPLAAAGVDQWIVSYHEEKQRRGL
jgi:S1-C subfamily serine protease